MEGKKKKNGKSYDKMPSQPMHILSFFNAIIIKKNTNLPQVIP